MNIEQLALEAGFVKGRDGLEWVTDKTVERFAALVRNEALEEAAKSCQRSDEDGEGPDCWDWHAKDFAAAIRAMKTEVRP
jgi:hypothetical protein